MLQGLGRPSLGCSAAFQDQKRQESVEGGIIIRMEEVVTVRIKD